MSELQRICDDLVAVVDEGTAVAEQLRRAARSTRGAATTAAALSRTADGGVAQLRRLAQVLDSAARECDRAAALLAQTRASARSWAARTAAAAGPSPARRAGYVAEAIATAVMGSLQVGAMPPESYAEYEAYRRRDETTLEIDRGTREAVRRSGDSGEGPDDG